MLGATNADLSSGMPEIFCNIAAGQSQTANWAATGPLTINLEGNQDPSTFTFSSTGITVLRNGIYIIEAFAEFTQGGNDQQAVLLCERSGVGVGSIRITAIQWDCSGGFTSIVPANAGQVFTLRLNGAWVSPYYKTVGGRFRILYVGGKGI